MRVSQHWRLNLQRYQLVGERCEHCGEPIIPPRDICPACARLAQKTHVFTGMGTLYSYTTVLDAPAGFEEQAPYVLALVKLDEGPLISAQLTDLGDTQIELGMPVEMVTRKLRTDGDKGIIVYGYKFRPIL